MDKSNKINSGNGCFGVDAMSGNGEPCYALQVILESVNKLDDKLNKRFDEMARNREDAAREQGETREKIRTLQEFKESHTDDHKWLFRSILAALLAAGGALIVAIMKKG